MLMVQDSQGRVNVAAQSKSVALVFSQLFIKRDYLAWWMGAAKPWHDFHSLNPGLPASDRSIWRRASPAAQQHAGKRKPRQMGVDGHLRTPQERRSRQRWGCAWVRLMRVRLWPPRDGLDRLRSFFFPGWRKVDAVKQCSTPGRVCVLQNRQDLIRPRRQRRQSAGVCLQWSSRRTLR